MTLFIVALHVDGKTIEKSQKGIECFDLDSYVISTSSFAICADLNTVDI